MPAHLPALTRRRFIQHALAFSAGIAAAPGLFAKSKGIDQNSWALLSDTHIAADAAFKARDINMTEHFRAVSKELLALPTVPAGVIVSGDLAYNSGQSADYAALAELLVPMRGARMPVHLLFGNHDNRERFWSVFPNEKALKQVVQGRQASMLKARRLNWFMLDSLDKTNSTPGVIGFEQLEWLTNALDMNNEKPAVIVVHHNPAQESKSALNDTEALLEILRPRRQVKMLVFGHTHRWSVKQDPGGSGLHFVNLPPVAYIFEQGDPSGWVHATSQKNGMALELRCVQPEHKLHGQKVVLEWRRS